MSIPLFGAEIGLNAASIFANEVTKFMNWQGSKEVDAIQSKTKEAIADYTWKLDQEQMFQADTQDTKQASSQVWAAKVSALRTRSYYNTAAQERGTTGTSVSEVFQDFATQNANKEGILRDNFEYTRKQGRARYQQGHLRYINGLLGSRAPRRPNPFNPFATGLDLLSIGFKGYNDWSQSSRAGVGAA